MGPKKNVVVTYHQFANMDKVNNVLNSDLDELLGNDDISSCGYTKTNKTKIIGTLNSFVTNRGSINVEYRNSNKDDKNELTLYSSNGY